MSVRNLDRVLRTSTADGAARMALSVVAFYGHDDGVLDNSRFTLSELAERGSMHPDHWSRATKDLARAGELVILQQVGRYARVVYGVVCGLYGLDRLEVVHAAWSRAAKRGGTFTHHDDLTLASGKRWVSVEPVMLDAQRRSLIVIDPEFNADISSVNADQTSALERAASISVFLVPREQQQQGEERKAQVLRLSPEQEKRRLTLRLLGVYDLKARRYAAELPLAWIDKVTEAGHMIREGTRDLGAAVCAMMEGKEPLPALSPEATPRVAVVPEERSEPPVPPEDVKRYGVRAAALLATQTVEQLTALGEWKLAEERARRDAAENNTQTAAPAARP